MTKIRPFLSTCYGDPPATEVPPCCEAATTKLTFSTTSVLLLLNVPLSLSRGTVFRRPKYPRRGYRPKVAGILFVYNEPEGKYYTVPNNIDWCNFILCYHCIFFISQSTSFFVDLIGHSGERFQFCIQFYHKNTVSSLCQGLFTEEPLFVCIIIDALSFETVANQI